MNTHIDLNVHVLKVTPMMGEAEEGVLVSRNGDLGALRRCRIPAARIRIICSPHSASSRNEGSFLGRSQNAQSKWVGPLPEVLEQCNHGIQPDSGHRHPWWERSLEVREMDKIGRDPGCGGGK